MIQLSNNDRVQIASALLDMVINTPKFNRGNEYELMQEVIFSSTISSETAEIIRDGFKSIGRHDYVSQIDRILTSPKKDAEETERRRKKMTQFSNEDKITIISILSEIIVYNKLPEKDATIMRLIDTFLNNTVIPINTVEETFNILSSYDKPIYTKRINDLMRRYSSNDLRSFHFNGVPFTLSKGTVENKMGLLRNESTVLELDRGNKLYVYGGFFNEVHIL